MITWVCEWQLDLHAYEYLNRQGMSQQCMYRWSDLKQNLWSHLGQKFPSLYMGWIQQHEYTQWWNSTITMTDRTSAVIKFIPSHFTKIHMDFIQIYINIKQNSSLYSNPSSQLTELKRFTKFSHDKVNSPGAKGRILSEMSLNGMNSLSVSLTYHS